MTFVNRHDCHAQCLDLATWVHRDDTAAFSGPCATFWRSPEVLHPPPGEAGQYAASACGLATVWRRAA